MRVLMVVVWLLLWNTRTSGVEVASEGRAGRSRGGMGKNGMTAGDSTNGRKNGGRKGGHNQGQGGSSVSGEREEGTRTKSGGKHGKHHQGQGGGSGLPLCSFNNTKLNKLGVDDGNWILLGDGTFKFEMSRCKLRRFTHQQVKKCLAKEHIIFMGDSLSRYIYLSLAQLLSQHTWGQKWTKSTHIEEARSILWEKDFALSAEDEQRPWSSFYEASSGMLNKDPESIELCDCYRENHLPWYNETGQHMQQSATENRHYRYVPRGNLDDTVNDVRLSYIQWFGHMPMRGFKELSHLPRDASVTSYLERMGKKYCPPDSAHADERLLPYSAKCANYRREKIRWDFPSFFEQDKCKQFPENEGACLQFEREVIAPLNATSLIANIGWHSPIWQPEEEGKRFLGKLARTAETILTRKDPSTMEAHLPPFTWRSANSPAPFHGGSDTVAEEFVREQDARNPHLVGFWDLWALTEPLAAVNRALDTKNEGALQAAFAKYRMEVAHKAKGREVDLSIPKPMVDHAHYEPYVYAEINNIFLNGVCPL